MLPFQLSAWPDAASLATRPSLYGYFTQSLAVSSEQYQWKFSTAVAGSVFDKKPKHHSLLR
jgi:hypothetical protein